MTGEPGSSLVYKFYPPHWGRDAIYRERFKITTFEDINDPFEFLATSKTKKLRKKARDLRAAEFEEHGVISFAKNWNEPLLWSHYAQNHQGIALGFRIKNNRHKFDVKYSTERVQMPKQDNPEFGEHLLFNEQIRIRKHTAWAYEDEVRVFPSLETAISENGKYFYPFEYLGSLAEVILGHEYSSINDNALDTKLRNNGVEIITARLGFAKFEVTAQENSKMQKSI